MHVDMSSAERAKPSARSKHQDVQQWSALLACDPYAILVARRRATPARDRNRPGVPGLRTSELEVDLGVGARAMSRDCGMVTRRSISRISVATEVRSQSTL